MTGGASAGSSPAGGRRFAVPDVHGCSATLRYMVEDLLALTPLDTLFLLGDYIDRGPDSKGVLDLIMELQEKGRRVFAVRGNHEEMLLQACGDLTWLLTWIANGGGATLRSFGVDHPMDIPKSYRDFLSSLPWFIESDDYLFVHAGINFEAEDPYADLQAMIWTRSDDVRSGLIGGRRLVCGHTPRSRGEIAAGLEAGILRLDNGCVYAGQQGFGALCALDLDRLELHFVANRDS